MIKRSFFIKFQVSRLEVGLLLEEQESAQFRQGVLTPAAREMLVTKQRIAAQLWFLPALNAYETSR